MSQLGGSIARRELEAVTKKLEWPKSTGRIHQLDGPGPGNAVWVTLDFEHVTETFTAFGEKGLAAEAGAKRAAQETKAYLRSEAPVGEHLADQLLLWLALAGGGAFVTGKLSGHTQTHIDVIRWFLDTNIDVTPQPAGLNLIEVR